ncbi:MAG: hydrogenase [Cyanophyceae cyanobacterium]
MQESGQESNTGPILIVGYGNRLRCDDGAGPAVADAIARWVDARGLGAWVTVIEAHQLLPELAVDLATAAAVLFVDAAVDPALPPVAAPVPLDCSDLAAPTVGHGSQPMDLLALAKGLYDRAPAAWILPIPVADFCFSDRPSAAGQVAIDAAIAQVQRFIGEQLQLDMPRSTPPLQGL